MGYWRIAVRGLMVVVAFIALAAWGLYRASQQVPDFYREALNTELASADEAGDALELQVVALQNDLDAAETWELALTDTQVNGWLIADLPEKFPGLLPEEASDPRVVFRENVIFAACRVTSGKVNTVVSLKLEPFLTETPNEIGVRVQQVRAGQVPLPLDQVLQQATICAFQAGLSVRWIEDQGDPVALLALPTDRPELKDGIVVEQLTVDVGQLRVAGRVGAQPAQVAADGAGVKRQSQR